jgi:hypothetical protein
VQNIADQGILKTIPKTLSYDILKLTDDGKIRFATSPQAGNNQNQGILYNVLDDLVGFDLDIQARDEISFLFGRLPNPDMAYEKPLAFAVDSQGCGLTVYKSIDQQVRMRGACGDNRARDGYLPFSGEMPLEGINEQNKFEDLIIYESHIDNASLTISGHALLVDSGNNKAWVINYRIVTEDSPDFGDPIKGSGINNQLVNGQARQVLADAIDLGANPKSLVLNSDKSIAYAINEDDDSLTTFRLKDQNGKVIDTIARITATKVTMPLKNLIRDDLKSRLETANIVFSPNSLACRDVDAKSYLMVGLEGLKAGLVIDTEQIQPLAVPPPVLNKAPLKLPLKAPATKTLPSLAPISLPK